MVVRELVSGQGQERRPPVAPLGGEEEEEEEVDQDVESVQQ